MNSPTAFVLAAGLGTRLRPLTDLLPKPLVPLFHKPLVSFALDSLLAAGVGTLALNTHHLPEAFTHAFGKEPHYGNHPLHMFHEPLLLDTGGGIRNARSALSESTFFLYNGDILADLPLLDLLAHHRASGALATLLLREGGGVANIRFDASSGRVLDLRDALGGTEGEKKVYSGIAVLEPAIFDWIPEYGPYSIVDAWLEALRAGEKISGLVCSSEQWPLWMDLGTPAAYLEAHRLLKNFRPSYITDNGCPLGVESSWPQAIHPTAKIHSTAKLEGLVVAGPDAVVGEGVSLQDSILWPGAVIEPGAYLEGSIVQGIHPVSGKHQGAIL